MSKKELLFSVTRKDFKLDWFSGKGGGGQHRNKHQNCLRLTHIESGATATGQSNKERPANQKEALQNLVNHPKWKLWYASKVNEVLTGKSREEKVNESMAEENLLVEGKNESGQWDPGAIKIER